jgi:Flp pilus assembly protein TadD
MLLVCVPVALCGCHSMNRAATPPPVAPPAVGATAAPVLDNALARAPGDKTKTTTDAALDRSGFPKKLSREQEFNAHVDLGRFQENQENYELALEEYAKALELSEGRTGVVGSGKNPVRQALAHRRMGTVLDRLGRFEQAELEYRAALKLSPNDPKVWNDAGYSYYLQGRWPDSERALKTAAKLDPNSARIMTNLGLTLAASGKPDAALAQFTRASGPAAGHANLAYSLAAMGNTAEAQRHYRRALELQPEMPNAKAALAALDAKVARATQIASTSTPSPSPAPVRAASPMPSNKPAALPVVAALPSTRPPTAQGAQPVRPTPYPLASVPTASPKTPTNASQISQIAQAAPPTPTPTDMSVKRTAAPTLRRTPPPPASLPVPAPQPPPGPVPAFVPPVAR